MKYIVNADDYGRNHKANERITYCFQNGVISSSTIMANMPGYEEAVKTIKENNYTNQIGVHIVLDEGRPLTKEMQKCKKFCDDKGNYKDSIPRHQYLNKYERETVYKEIVAQIDKVLEDGIKATHIDSHRHRHQDLWVAMAMKKAAIERGITFIRRHKSNDRLYKRAYGEIIRCYFLYGKKLETTDRFISINDYTSDDSAPGICEIMCHPERDDDYNELFSCEKNFPSMISYSEI